MGVSFFAALSANKGAVEKTDVENTDVEKAAAENTAVESVADASSAELAGGEEQPALASPAPAASETAALEPATAPKEEGSVADVAIGNVVGSNICNILLVLGGTLSLVPGGLTIRAQTLCVDLPVMAASGALAGWFCFTGRELERWEAAILLAFQCGYAAYLVLA